MSAPTPQRTGVFLLTADEDLALATMGLDARPDDRLCFVTFDTDVPEGISPAEQAYRTVTNQTNLLISSRDLIPMEPTPIIEDGKKVECFYFYVPHIDATKLRVEKGRELIMMPVDDALRDAPMHSATQQMLRLLTHTPLITRSAVTRTYGARLGLEFTQLAQ